MTSNATPKSETKPLSVLFVCTGNICRSPSAEGVFLGMLEQEVFRDLIHVDSAGTHDYHVGDPPDPRSQETARLRGYDLSRLRARKIHSRDFETFDYLLAMDREHYHLMLAACPEGHREKVVMFLDFAEGFEGKDVPDPYYGGEDGFEHVLDLIEAASRGLMEHLRETHAAHLLRKPSANASS